MNNNTYNKIIDIILLRLNEEIIFLDSKKDSLDFENLNEILNWIENLNLVYMNILTLIKKE